jgi:hypothetical protein
MEKVQLTNRIDAIEGGITGLEDKVKGFFQYKNQKSKEN